MFIFRFFWVRWDNGLIEVGQGVSVGASRLLFFQDNDASHRHQVNSLGFASKGMRSQWILGRVDGNIISSILQSEDPGYKKLVVAPINKQNVFVFDIKACKKVAKHRVL